MAPATNTSVVNVRVPPPDDAAVVSIWYVPLISSVGSKVASVCGGAPLPDASTTGVPPSRLRTETFHCVMVWPVGGVMLAVMPTGAVTRLPLAGEEIATVGGEPAAAVTLTVTRAGVDTNPGRSTAT